MTAQIPPGMQKILKELGDINPDMRKHVEEATTKVFASSLDHYEMFVGSSVREVAKFCESPIELMLGAALLATLRTSRAAVSERFSLCTQDNIPAFPADHILLVPQYRFQGFRIDWALRITKFSPPLIFIECDGHEFHERTKEQAARDRSRDREIQASGIPIIRFTGSEIFRDPTDCVLQVASFIRSRLNANGIDEL